MLVPAIHFPRGTCAEAIAFYQKVFDATVIEVVHGNDAPPDYEPEMSDEVRKSIIHAELVISGTRVNMADGADEISPGGMFSFNVFFDSTDEVEYAFQQLEDGGEVLTKLGAQFWTPLYGEVRDRFGIVWQLMAN